MSHELKSPLASLRLSVETLAMRDPPPAQRGELVRRMLVELGRLQGMIANVLDASRLAADGRAARRNRSSSPRRSAASSKSSPASRPSASVTIDAGVAGVT